MYHQLDPACCDPSIARDRRLAAEGARVESGRKKALAAMRQVTSAVIHIGPHIYSFGGTQSVIRTISDASIGADRVYVLATWVGPSHVNNGRLLGAAARALLRAPRGAVAHFHVSNGGGWVREGLLMRVARAQGLRTVATLHGFDVSDFVRAHPEMVRTVLSKVDHVICLSEHDRDLVATLLGTIPVSVVPNPVVIDRLSSSAADTRPVALFAGTIGYRKGVDILADAWGELVERGVPGECRLVGPVDDFCPPPLKRLRVEPPVHPRDVPALIREARVVVLPSRAEAMPMILTEALAARRPFVATAVGGTGDITPDPEMLVPVGDTSALADALARFMLEPETAGAAGQAGQDYIVETRSPEIVDRRLREIYAGIAL